MNIPVIQDETLNGVQNWIEEIDSSDLKFHYDDDVMDVFSHTLNDAYRELLNEQHELANRICDDYNTSIWDLVQ